MLMSFVFPVTRVFAVWTGHIGGRRAVRDRATPRMALGTWRHGYVPTG